MNAMKEMDVKRVGDALKVLGEHFDAVQIFATRHEGNEGGTTNVQMGCGNWYARYGHVRAWVVEQEKGGEE